MLHSPCLTLPSQRTTLCVQALGVFMSPFIHCWELMAWACKQDWHFTLLLAPESSHGSCCTWSQSLGHFQECACLWDTSTQSCICSPATLPCHTHASDDDSHSCTGCPKMAPAASGGGILVCNAPTER